MSLMLNAFSVKYLEPEVELMYLLRMRRYHRHKIRRKWCRAPELTACLYQNGRDEFKYDVTFSTGSNNVVETAHAQ